MTRINKSLMSKCIKMRSYSSFFPHPELLCPKTFTDGPFSVSHTTLGSRTSWTRENEPESCRCSLDLFGCLFPRSLLCSQSVVIPANKIQNMLAVCDVSGSNSLRKNERTVQTRQMAACVWRPQEVTFLDSQFVYLLFFYNHVFSLLLFTSTFWM